MNRIRETLRDLDVRRSTYVLCGVWIAVFLLYLWVRPEPQDPQAQLQQFVPAPTTTSAPPVVTSTTVRPTTTITTTTPSPTESTVPGSGPFEGGTGASTTTTAPIVPNWIPTQLIPPQLLPATPTPTAATPSTTSAPPR